MWQIIKAEYLHTITISKSNALPISFALIIPIFIILGKMDSAIFYLFLVGAILSFLEDNRFYLYQRLPIANKRIALARLIMLGINNIILLAIVIPLVIYLGTNINDNLLKLFAVVGILLLIRVFSFSIFDITSGFLLKKRKYYLSSLLLFGALILAIYAYVLTIYFRKPQMTEIFIVVSFFLVPILSFISIKTFLAKERITVREK